MTTLSQNKSDNNHMLEHIVFLWPLPLSELIRVSGMGPQSTMPLSLVEGSVWLAQISFGKF